MSSELISTIGLVAFFMVLMVPRIVRTLTKHQQEMAEILRRDNAGNPQLEAEVRELRAQVARLNEIVTDHILSAPKAPSVQARIGEQEVNG